ATTVAGTGILGELPGQLGKILTGINARLDRLGLLAGGHLITIHLEQDVAGPTLLGQIADLALVHGVQSRLVHFNLVEEVAARQGQCLQHDLFGTHEVRQIILVELLDAFVADAHRVAIQLHPHHGKITALVLQQCQLLAFPGRGKGRSLEAVAQLGQHQLLTHQLTESHARTHAMLRMTTSKRLASNWPLTWKSGVLSSIWSIICSETRRSASRAASSSTARSISPCNTERRNTCSS